VYPFVALDLALFESSELPQSPLRASPFVQAVFKCETSRCKLGFSLKRERIAPQVLNPRTPTTSPAVLLLLFFSKSPTCSLFSTRVCRLERKTTICPKFEFFPYSLYGFSRNALVPFSIFSFPSFGGISNGPFFFSVEIFTDPPPS